MRISDWISDVCSSDLEIGWADLAAQFIPADRHGYGRAGPRSGGIGRNRRRAATVPEIIDQYLALALRFGDRRDKAARAVGGQDRKSDVEGKRVLVRVDTVGRRNIKKKKKNKL